MNGIKLALIFAPPGYFGSIGNELGKLSDRNIGIELKNSGVEYVIASNFYDRLKKEARKEDFEKKNVYKYIFQRFAKLKSFEKNKDGFGNKITIYELKKQLHKSS